MITPVDIETIVDSLPITVITSGEEFFSIGTKIKLIKTVQLTTGMVVPKDTMAVIYELIPSTFDPAGYPKIVGSISVRCKLQDKTFNFKLYLSSLEEDFVVIDPNALTITTDEQIMSLGKESLLNSGNSEKRYNDLQTNNLCRKGVIPTGVHCFACVYFEHCHDPRKWLGD